MRPLGIGLIVLGLATAVYSYGIGFPAFLVGLAMAGAGTWLIMRGRHANA
jgi:hypothetical protein